MKTEAMKKVNDKLKEIVLGNLDPFTQAEAEAIWIIYRNFKMGVKEEQTILKKVRDYFEECGFEVEAVGIGWKIK